MVVKKEKKKKRRKKKFRTAFFCFDSFSWLLPLAFEILHFKKKMGHLQLSVTPDWWKTPRQGGLIYGLHTCISLAVLQFPGTEGAGNCIFGSGCWSDPKR